MKQNSIFLHPEVFCKHCKNEFRKVLLWYRLLLPTLLLNLPQTCLDWTLYFRVLVLYLILLESAVGVKLAYIHNLWCR